MPYIFNDDKSMAKIRRYSNTIHNVAGNSSPSITIIDPKLNTVTLDHIHVLSVMQCVHDSGADNQYFRWDSAGSIPGGEVVYPNASPTGWVPHDPSASSPHANKINARFHNPFSDAKDIDYTVLVAIV